MRSEACLAVHKVDEAGGVREVFLALAAVGSLFQSIEELEMRLS